MGNQNTMTA